jgi:MFS family permease
VPLRGDWRDRVGAFWLVGCVFGPFFGWIITSGVFPTTQSSWQWMYGLRVLLAAAVPLILALPLTRYVRGKSARVALPLLLGITLLPISRAMNVSLDLWEGPVVRQLRSTGPPELFLKHTGRSLRSGH